MAQPPTGERKPEYSSDIALAGSSDFLARGLAPFDPPSAPSGAGPAAEGGGSEAAVEDGQEAAGRRDVRVTVRVPAPEAARWRELAEAGGVSVSDWVRVRLAQAGAEMSAVTGRPTPRRRPLGRARYVAADPAVIEQLARIGNNLNQLARWANTQRRPADLAILWSVGRQLTQLREAVTSRPASDEEGVAGAEVVVDLTHDGQYDDHEDLDDDLEVVEPVAGVAGR